ncbi:MAG: DUF5686 family protein [Bacteroidota bacterium]
MKPALLLPIALFCRIFVAVAPLNAQEAGDDTTRSNLGSRINRLVDDILERAEHQVMDYFGERESAPIAVGVSLAEYENRYLKDRVTIARFTGDLVIEEEEEFEGSVVVSSGDVTLYGRINGDLLVIDGDVYIRQEGWVSGAVVVVNGKIHRDDESVVWGEGGLLSAQEVVTARSSFFCYHPKRRYTLNWLSQSSNVNDFLLRYNRVEGIFLGLGSSKKYYWDGRQRYSIYGSIGWGFKTHRWRYHLGFDRWFGNENRFEVGVEGHSFTDTKDGWRIEEGENTASAFFVREDYRDYFGREGIGIHVAHYFSSALRLRADYLVDKYKSLPRNTEWALFGGDTRFRINPSVDEGLMRSVVIGFDVTTMDENRHRLHGWNAHASAEFAGGELGGEFEFDRYLLDVRRYQPISNFDNVNFRVRVGFSSRPLPDQKTFELGGLGTMPAYRFKEFSGNRMILANAEYLLGGRVLNELSFWPMGLFSRLHLILFADAGWTGTAQTDAGFTDGFDAFAFRDVKTDLGFGFCSRDGVLRIQFAWRTDRAEPVRISLRLNRPF